MRPIIGVRRCSNGAVADGRRAARRDPRSTRSHASRICSACAVSITSDEVMPKWSQRADGPTCSATAVVNAMTSCWVICSISSMRAMSKAPRSRMSRAASSGHDAGRGHRLGGRGLDEQPGLVPALVAPDAAHLRVRVACDHEGVILDRVAPRGSCNPFTLPSTVAASAPFANRSAATRCTSSGVTRSTPCSVSSRPNWRSK